eukprot:1159911-Pelagomonas_calceolata.AAC.12
MSPMHKIANQWAQGRWSGLTHPSSLLLCPCHLPWCLLAGGHGSNSNLNWNPLSKHAPQYPKNVLFIRKPRVF